jgi:hypothetical protein
MVRLTGILVMVLLPSNSSSYQREHFTDIKVIESRSSVRSVESTPAYSGVSNVHTHTEKAELHEFSF